MPRPRAAGRTNRSSRYSPGRAEKRGERKKIQREADRCAIDAGEYDLRVAPRTKKRLPEKLIGGNHLMREALELRQLANEAQHQRHLGLFSRAHAHVCSHAA